MRGLLEEVELRAKQLMVYDSEVIDIPPKNAERFARISEGNGSGIFGLTVGKELNAVSSMGFVKACLDAVQSQRSLILGAKAILAARLALNTLSKVCSSTAQLILELPTVFSNSTRSVLEISITVAQANRPIVASSTTSRASPSLRLYNGFIILRSPPTLPHNTALLHSVLP